MKLRNLDLPTGTALRMVDGDELHRAEVIGDWIQVGGRQFDTPSAAAIYCTGRSLNGWDVWLAKRPSDTAWTPLSWLRVGLTAG